MMLSVSHPSLDCRTALSSQESVKSEDFIQVLHAMLDGDVEEVRSIADAEQLLTAAVTRRTHTKQS